MWIVDSVTAINPIPCPPGRALWMVPGDPVVVAPISVAALHERLRRPRWRWLREKGEKHAGGRLRWERAILDEVDE